MIASIWHCVTHVLQSERYLEYLNQSVVPHYQTEVGNQGVFVLRDIRGELAHYLILSFWESKDALNKFAMQDCEIVYHPPEVEEYLIAYESLIKKYQVMCAKDHPE